MEEDAKEKPLNFDEVVENSNEDREFFSIAEKTEKNFSIFWKRRMLVREMFLLRDNKEMLLLPLAKWKCNLSFLILTIEEKWFKLHNVYKVRLKNGRKS